MRNLEAYENSKPASAELRNALVPGPVRAEVLRFGELVSLRANQLEGQKQPRMSDGMVHAIPRLSPRTEQSNEVDSNNPGLVRAIRKLSPTSEISKRLNSGIPTEPFLSDSFEVPPSTRIVEVPRKSDRS